MGLSENKQLVQAFFDAGSRGDLESGLDLMADDVAWTNIGSTKFSGTYVGKEALIADLLGPLFGQLRSGISTTLENMIAESDFVVVLSRGRAETNDGRPYNNTYCHVFRVEVGKIREVTEYFDTELTSAVFGP
jgi:ketosteroid isomerase-like protein